MACRGGEAAETWLDDARLTTSQAPPIAPRCRSCRLVSMTLSLRSRRDRRPRRRDAAGDPAVSALYGRSGVSCVAGWRRHLDPRLDRQVERCGDEAGLFRLL